MAFVFLLNPGTGPVNTILGRLGLPEPGWFNDPSLVEAGADPAGAVGHRRPDGDLHGRAARRAAGSSTRPPSSTAPARWQRFRYVTLPHISPILLFAVVTGVIATMQYYTEPLVAGKVASGRDRRLRARSSSPATRTSSTLTLPQLVYNLGFQRFDIGAACVIALVLFALSMVVHRAADAARQRLPGRGD